MGHLTVPHRLVELLNKTKIFLKGFLIVPNRSMHLFCEIQGLSNQLQTLKYLLRKLNGFI